MSGMDTCLHARGDEALERLAHHHQVEEVVADLRAFRTWCHHPYGVEAVAEREEGKRVHTHVHAHAHANGMLCA